MQGSDSQLKKSSVYTGREPKNSNSSINQQLASHDSINRGSEYNDEERPEGDEVSIIFLFNISLKSKRLRMAASNMLLNIFIPKKTTNR
jgi:hypothetical protein